MRARRIIADARPPGVACAWADLLDRVPDRHRGATFLRAVDVARWWCASGLAGHATALGWDEVELFGVRASQPFRAAPLVGLALTGVPRILTDRVVHFHDGRAIRRGQFGPDFIPLWCLDRRLRRPERHLVQLPNGLWAPVGEGRAA